MSLAFRIAALAASLVCAVGLLLLFMVREGTERTVVQREEERLSRTLSFAAQTFEAEVTHAIADVRVVAGAASTKGVVGALSREQTAGASGETPSAGVRLALVQWEDQLAQLFRAILAANATYLQARVIDAAGGEIVRVDSTPAGIVRVPTDKLQRKDDRPYFKKAIALQPGEIYVSQINLNQERGEIEEPHRPVLRVAAPVTSTEGVVRGIVIINIDFTAMLKSIRELSAGPLTLYMTTAEGDYLTTPDHDKAFGFDLGQRHRIQSEFPSLPESFIGNDVPPGASKPQRLGEILLQTFALSVGDDRGRQCWVFVGVLDLQRSLADFLNFQRLLLVAVLLLMALGSIIAVILARRIVAPLRRLAAALRTVGEGNFDISFKDVAGKDKELAEVKSAFLVMRDAIKCRERRLRDERARSDAVIENAVNPIVIIDEMGRILDANEATYKAFGYAASELEGENVSILVPSPCREAHDGYLKAYEETGEKKIIGTEREVTAQRKDGSAFPVELGVAEVRLGRGRAFVGTLTDLSEIKKLEQIKLEKLNDALKLEKMKGEFVSTVSHELRTPLTAIKGSLGLVLAESLGALPDKTKTMISMAYNNSERLTRLINDILDLDKINSGQVQFELGKVQVAALLNEVVVANTGFGDLHKVKIKLKPPVQSLAVRADYDRICQVLTNLISNAVKYSPEGGEVMLSASRRKECVRISVTDTGAGIPKEFRSRIFSRFAQADSSDTRQRGGTGLGLSIAKAIVEAHGGAIGFRTVEGQGTTFFVDLPLYTARVGGGLEASPRVAAPLKGTVLICDDAPDSAERIKAVVESEGYGSQTCRTAAAARRMLQQDDFVAMTLDVARPHTIGTAWLGELRAQSKNRNLPIVVVSAMAPRFDPSAFKQVDWLAKPLDVESLRASLERLTMEIDQPPVRILHIEDDKDCQDIVAHVVGRAAQLEQAGSLEEAANLLQIREYDIVILDLVLPDGPGEQLLPGINQSKAKVAPAVLVYSIRQLPEAFEPFVDAVLVKSQDDTNVLRLQIERLAQQVRRRARPVSAQQRA
jgi:PAS domain S-box-containing protein